MTLNEYQKKAMTTCMPSSENFSYMMLNLMGEVGEFSSKVAKAIRKGLCTPAESVWENYDGGGRALEPSYHIANMPYSIAEKEIERTDEEMEALLTELKKETGDIAWQLAGLCHVMGWKLEDICQMNLDKLASRKERNVIDGNGDNR